MDRTVAHIVLVDRRRNFTSTTLPPDGAAELESAFRAVPWWRDRWSHSNFRAAARRALARHGGLALLGPGTRLEPPPPFTEMFEPIEVAGGFGAERRRLRVLSGDALTRQERFNQLFWPIGALLGLVVISAAFVFPRLVMHPAVSVATVGVVLALGVVFSIISAVRRWSGRWFLIPGAIAAVRRPARPGRPARITVLSRRDTVLVLRLVSTGKSTMLIMELWAPAGRILRRAVSEREALGVLAAWQSPLDPPPDERLQELAG